MPKDIILVNIVYRCFYVKVWTLKYHKVNFVDTTNSIAAIRFSVLAIKPLVVSKKFASQTPL